MRALSPETPASLWQNELGFTAFHHELNQSANKPAARRRSVNDCRADSRQTRRADARPKFHYRKADTWKGAFAMPTETAIVVGAIVAVFAIYAATSIWADFYTRNYHPPL
jgi:hypothetical protein